MGPIVELLAGKVVPINGAFSPASAEEIAAAERDLGFAFPASLYEIQANFGRCMFSGEALVDIPGSKPLGIFTLFGCKGPVGNLVSDFRSHPEMQGDGLVPFADDMFNNRFVWRSTRGDVLFLDYSTKSPPIVIASSVEDLVRKIRVIPD